MTDVLIERFIKSREQDAQKNQFRSSLTYGMQQNPDQQVKVQQTAGLLGTTPDAVQADPSYFEQAANAQAFDFDSYIRRSPIASNWLSHPENAAVAHDDTGVLASIEDVASQIAQIPQKAMGGVFRAIGGASMLAGTNPLLKAWLFPGNEASATAAREVGEDVRKYYLPLLADPSLLPTTTAGRGAEFLGGIAGAMGKAVGTGPFAPLVFGAEAFGESAGASLDRGATPWQATGKAVGSGAINTLLGLIPGSKFGGEEALAQAIKRGGVASIIGEAAKGVGVRAARGTVLGTGVTVGENLLDRITGVPNKHLLEGATENIKTFIGMELAGYMSHAIGAAAESKLKKRSEAAFNSAVTEMFKGSGVEEIGIPADRLETLFQTGGPELVAVASEIRAKFGEDVAARYLAAKATGADVTLKMADFLSKLDPEQHKAIFQDVRMNPDLPTMRERADWEASGGPERTKDLLRQDVSAEEASTPDYKAVFEESRRRYIAAGERPEVADDYATLQANVYTNWARESGQTAADLFRLYDPKVVLGEVPTTLEGGGQNGRSAILNQPGAGDPGAPQGRESGFPVGHGSSVPEGGADQTGGRVRAESERVGSATRNPLQFNLDQSEHLDLAEYKGNPELPGFKGDRNGVHISFFDDASYLVVKPGGLSESAISRPNVPQVSLLVSNKGDSVKVGVTDGDFKGYGVTATKLITEGLKVIREAWPDVQWVHGDLVGGEAIHAWRARFPSTRFGEIQRDPAPFRVGDLFAFAPNPDELIHGLTPVVTNIDDIIQGKRVPDAEYNRRLVELGFKPRREVMQHGEGQGQGEEGRQGRQGLLGNQGGPGGSPDLLHQPGEATPRGWFRVLPDGTFEIGKTKIGDLSTFVHEPAHGYLYMLRDLAALPTASESLKSDYQKVLKFLGAEPGAELTRDQHEKWATANEAYIREGKAPTEGLRGVFQRFAVWLGSIYRKVDALGVKLDPEIRGVMDRMYAGDRAVDEAAKMVDVRPLFTSAEMMGWTQAEYDLYASKAASAISTAHAEVNARLQREYLRERETWWKEEARNVRAGVQEEVSADPTYRAIQILKDGEMPVPGEDGPEVKVPLKLNRQAIIDQFGEETLKKLPRGLRDHKGGGTMDAEAAAELLGFDSGHALIDAITKAEPKNDLVERITSERMKEKHGDLLTAGIESVAVEELHNKSREEMLHAELQALRQKERELRPGRELQRKLDDAKTEAERQAAQDAWDAYQKDQKAIAAEGRQQARAATEVPPAASFREAARDFVSEQTPRDLDPYSYLLASRREAKRAFDSMAKDDYAGAADAKQKELLNHHMFLEATKAKAEAGKIAEYGRKGQTVDFQSKLGLAGREFQDQWNALAERYEFRKVTDTELDVRSVLRGLGEWQKEFEEDGAIIDPALLAGGAPRNWREVPMSELRAVRDGLKNIETVARRQLGATLDGIKLDLEIQAGMFDATARAALGSKPVPRSGTKLTLLEKVQSKLQGFNAYAQKLEWYIDQLDGGDINGPARRNIKAPIDNASAREKEMGHEIKLKLLEVFKDRTQEERSHEFDGIGVRFPGMDRDLNRAQLFSWALNLGTAENRKVATLGEQLVAEDGSLRPEFEQALSKLTSKEAQRLQGVWDALESMRPAVIEKERRTTGVEPKWKEVTPLTFKTADGEVVTLKGGYYPLKADPNIDNIGRRQIDPANMVDKYGLPKVNDSHTKTVTGATYRLLLDYPTVLGQHVPAVIKNVTMGEAIKYVSQFITRNDVTNTLKETLGLGKETEFEPWLKAVAGNGIDNDQGGPVMRWLMGRRMGMVTARLGGNLTSYLVQLGDSTKLLSTESGAFLAQHLPQAYIDIRRNPKAMIEEIRQLSPNEMRFREENFNREIRDLLTSRDVLDENRQRVTEFLMTGFQVIDRLQTFPAWLAKYREGLANHGDEAQAVKEADRLIARTFQAGEARNLSRIMREQGLMKLFTTFQGDANTWYGILSSAFESKNVKRISVGLMAVIGEQMLSSVIRGRIPSDEDKLAGWTIGNVMSALFNPLGIFGDFAEFAMKKASGQFAKFNNPTLDSLEKVVTIPASARAYHEGRKDAEGLAIDVTEAAGLWLGIPGTGQLIKSWKYQHGLRAGTQPAPSSTAAEIAHTLLGPPPKEK